MREFIFFAILLSLFFVLSEGYNYTSANLFRGSFRDVAVSP